MNCRNCGKPSQEGGRYCIHCGAVQAAPPEAKPAGKQQKAKGFHPAFWWMLGFGVLFFAGLVVAGGIGLNALLRSGPHLFVQPTARTATTVMEASQDPSLVVQPTAKIASPETEAPQAVLPDLDRVTLDWYCADFDPQPDIDLVLDRVDNYLQPRINASVILHTISWNEYPEKINLLLASGEPFDIFSTQNVTDNYIALSRKGNLLALNGLLESHGQDIVKVLGRGILRSTAVDGKNYVIPENALRCHSWGLLLRQDLVEKYGVETKSIESLEDLAPAFAAIKAGEPGVYPLLANKYAFPFDLMNWDKTCDDDLPGALYSNNKDSNVRFFNEYAAPESLQMYKLLREYYAAGYINPDAPTLDEYYSDSMKTGKFFAVAQILWPGADFSFSSSGYQWVQVQLTPSVQSSKEAGYAMLAIPKASENPERAMMFCNLLYSDSSLLNLLYFGIEGEHYSINSQGMASKKSDAGYFPIMNTGYGNQFLTLLNDFEIPGKWELYAEENANATVLRSRGFLFDASAVQAKADACKQVMGKYRPYLLSGAGEDDVEEMVGDMNRELDEAGLCEVLAEMQRQYDEWLAGRKK